MRESGSAFEVKAQGVYSLEHVTAWVDVVLPALPRRKRRQFLACACGIELGAMTYHLERLETGLYRVHCAPTEELRSLFAALERASVDAGFLPIRVIHSIAGALIFLFITSAAMFLGFTYLETLPRWVPLLLSLASIGIGAICGYFTKSKFP